MQSLRSRETLKMSMRSETNGGARTARSLPGSANASRLHFVRFLADLLDQRFTIPGTFTRVGLNPILGLIPGIGDSRYRGSAECPKTCTDSHESESCRKCTDRRHFPSSVIFSPLGFEVTPKTPSCSSPMPEAMPNALVWRIGSSWQG
jgi:Domain of unknown function (DUF4112)